MQIQFVSQSLGILSTLFSWITSALGSLIAVIIKIAVGLVSNLLYAISVQLLGLLDFVQMVFKRLSGLDTHWYNGTGREEDILLSLFQDPAVLNSLIAMTIVAIAMLIIATIVQIIRVEYTTEGAKNTKGGIIGASFKALAMFMIVPIGSFLGIFISNQLLRSIEAATNTTGTPYIGGAIFVASAHSANRVRITEQDNPTNDIIEQILNIVSTAALGGILGPEATQAALNALNLVNSDHTVVSGYDNSGMFTSTKSDPIEKRNEIAEKLIGLFQTNMKIIIQTQLDKLEH